MKVVLRVVVGLATVAVVYAGLAYITLIVGGSECDRGDCNFVGDAAADSIGKWLIAFGYLAVAAVLGLIAARSLRGTRLR